MKKITLCLFVSIFSSTFLVKAESYDFEKLYYDSGYKEVNEAWQESAVYFKRTISLPTKLPPIPFTHHFGRLTKDLGKVNDQFEVTYLNEERGDHHFFIRIVPSENGLPLRAEHKEQEFSLKGGKMAVYSTNIAKGFNFLIFENDGWQYLMAIDKRVSDKVPAERLVEIADSIK